jgi:CysZ protein
MMNGVALALARALRSMLHPKLLMLSVFPTLAALVLWGSLTLFFWSPLNAWVADWLKNTTAVDAMLYLARVLFQWEMAGLIPGLARFLILLTVLPLIQATALMIAAVLLMPLMVRHVADRSYAGLERRRGGNFFGSLWSAVVGASVFMFLWVASLPLWLVPGLALLLPLALSAYLNQRLFCYDAIADHADRAELDAILRGRRVGRFGLGALLGVVHYVPVLGWFAPVYMGLAFAHWGLAELAAGRKAAAA